MVRKKKISKWEYAARAVLICELVLLACGVLYNYTQYNDSKGNQLNRQNDLAIRYYDKLSMGTNDKIYYSIEHKSPLKFTEAELDNYLGVLHDVGEDLYRDLLDGQKVCSNFSDFAIKTWNNDEIQEYLLKIRKDDPQYFLGFDDLYHYVLTCQ